MKNRTLSIVMILLIVLCIGFLTYFMIHAMKDNSFILFGKKTVIDEISYDTEYDEEINYISIDGNLANVNIKESDTNKFKLLIHSKKDKTDVKINNKKLYIHTEMDTCKFLCFNEKVAQIDIYVPREYKDEIKINNSIGDIKIANIESLNLNIETKTGDIKIDKVLKCYIKTKTGDININSVDDLEIETKVGDIEIASVTGVLDIETKTGDIKINNVEIKDNSHITTDVGDIKIKNTYDIYVDAKTDVGDTKVNNNNRKSEIELSIKTRVGDIKVN